MTAVLFETKQQVLFSQLAEQNLGMELKWKAWKPRVFNVDSDGVLTYRRDANSPPKFKFNLAKVKITLMADSRDLINPTAAVKNENGVIVSCTTMDGFDTYFRCILNDEELRSFYGAIKFVSKDHNLDNIATSGVYVAPSGKYHGNQSVMRQTLAKAMDTHDKRAKKDRIRGRRGVFKYLPVCYSNDLVHGSIWFTIGSLLFLITSIMIFINSWYEEEFLGTDDSFLHRFSYRCTWALMIISAIFCTLGSMAFVRAVHEEPQMKPLFPNWYHFQSDELLGSWLFLAAVLPIIPYSLIYLAQSGNNIVYLGALGIAVCLVFGTYMFVRACYPTENGAPSTQFIQPVLHVLCCLCFSKRWLDKHLANDWLAGTWLIYWGTLIACIVCAIVLAVVIYDDHHLSIFTLATGLFENFTFLLGSAYFVAGSYPEQDDHEEGEEGSNKMNRSQIHSSQHSDDSNSNKDVKQGGVPDIETGSSSNKQGTTTAAPSPAPPAGIAMKRMEPSTSTAPSSNGTAPSKVTEI